MVFFDEQEMLAVNRTVEGYQLGADGAELSGVESISGQYVQIIVPVVAQQTTAASSEKVVSEASKPKPVASETEAAKTITYVLNINTKKFHKPSYSSVSDMAVKNRLDSDSSRDDIIAQGYVPCRRCKP